MITKQKIGVFWGRFDVLHIGHLNAFEFCREHCDRLVVGVATDKYCIAEHNYGAGANIMPREMWNSFEARRRMVAAIRTVDEVYGYEQSCPHALCKDLRTQGINVAFAFLNPEYEGSAVYENSIRGLEGMGIEAVFVPRTGEVGSTEIRKACEAQQEPVRKSE